MVGQSEVREDMHKQLPTRAHPRCHTREKLPVVFHVLEHFHGDHAVIGCRLRFKVVHIGCHDFNVSEAAGCGGFDDICPLGARIGDGGDFSARVFFSHPKRKAPPPAAQLKDALAVGHLRPLATESEHGLLRFREGRGVGRPIARAVFHAGSKHELKKLCGYLVVLLVGRVRFDGDRAAVEFGEKIHERGLLGGGVPFLIGEFFGEEAADTDSNGGIGEKVSCEQ